MASKSFLHPSQRNLKTEQIGPSGHKNQYHVGVLEGNWFEERRGFGPQPTSTATSGTQAVTTQRESYNDIDDDTRRAAKPGEACSLEAPRELLFHHGTGHTSSQFSVFELSFRGARSESALRHTDIISIEGISPRRTRTNAKRAEAAYGANDDDNASQTTTSDCRTVGADGKVRYHLPPIGVALTKERFTTTKHVTVDAVGRYLQDNLTELYEPSAVTKSRGAFLRSLNASMHKTHLRL